MLELLNTFILFVTIISTIKMLFLDIHNKNHRKIEIEKQKEITTNNTAKLLYNKEKLNHICIDNNTYYIDIRDDNYIDGLQNVNSNLHNYIYA